MTENSDHYTILGIERSAGPEQVRIAVAHQLRRWNGRASNSPNLEARQRAESMVVQLNKAKRELLDPDLRAAYDARLRRGTGTAGGRTAVPPAHQAAPHAQPQGSAPEAQGSEWYDRAWQSVEDKRYEDALYEARKATGVTPRHVGSWLLLGWLRMKNRDVDGARLAFDTSTVLAPDDPRPHMEIGDLHRYQGNLTAAAAGYRRASELGPHNEEYRKAEQQAREDIVRRTHAESLYEQGEFREALDIYQDLAEHSYGDAELHNQIGRAMSVVANTYKYYPPDGSLPYIDSAESAADVRTWAQAALSYELTDLRLVKKLREDIHFAEMVLERTGRV